MSTADSGITATSGPGIGHGITDLSRIPRGSILAVDLVANNQMEDRAGMGLRLFPGGIEPTLVASRLFGSTQTPRATFSPCLAAACTFQAFPLSSE